WLAGQDKVLRAAGVPPAMRVSIAAAALQIRAQFPEAMPDSLIQDGQVIETALGPMEAILTPGHSHGHMCFYLPEQKVLLAGDHLLKARMPHLEWHPEVSVLDEFVQSLERLARLDVEWVLPSHGQPFRNHTLRIQMLLRECDRRLARIQEVRQGGGKKVHKDTLVLSRHDKRAVEQPCPGQEKPG